MSGERGRGGEGRGGGQRLTTFSITQGQPQGWLTHWFVKAAFGAGSERGGRERGRLEDVVAPCVLLPRAVCSDLPTIHIVHRHTQHQEDPSSPSTLPPGNAIASRAR